jgi:hypothetical protein
VVRDRLSSTLCPVRISIERIEIATALEIVIVIVPEFMSQYHCGTAAAELQDDFGLS